MTIAVSLNLSDGAILGADSAITIVGAAPGPGAIPIVGVLKVYNEAEKVFRLSKLPVGMVTYGMAMMAQRTIESYIREFEVEQPKGSLEKLNLQEICENLRKFFMKKYVEIVKPLLEDELKAKYEDIPPEKKAPIGLVLAGFSPGRALSEVWEIKIPHHEKKKDIRAVREKGQFGSNWFGEYRAISRFVKGFDKALLDDLVGYFLKKAGKEAVDEETRRAVSELVARHEYKIPFDAMPINEGIDHVRFMLDMVINQYRYVIGAPVCGGKVRIAVINNDRFRLIIPKTQAYLEEVGDRK